MNQASVSQASVNRKPVKAIALGTFAVVVALGAWGRAQAADNKAPYSNMAPVDQYLMADRDAEIALSRSAAPDSISKEAEVLVLGRHGYEIAVKGTNGFVCLVERSWASPIDAPLFWDPTLRAAICLNPPAARTYLPLTSKKTEWILAGQSKAQMFGSLKDALDKKELPPLESGAMCYMLSKQTNFGGNNGHWHPHLMFFVPRTGAQTWGADAPGSPILSSDDPQDRLTVFMIPVGKWSDGTPDSKD